MTQQRNQAAGKQPRKKPEAAGRCSDAKSLSPETASLLGLVDRLTSLLERSDLVELEVESGETGIVLRKPAALEPMAIAVGSVAARAAAGGGPGDPAAAGGAQPSAAYASKAKVVRAPLTGVFYAGPSPASPPYVSVGQHISAGQVIGLIEAMKLFNEIKSDTTGRVVRIVAESGKLVKAKQPLIEVEP
jgi:acetyl-CoA carboxylase biotin carboxyl carrier protein